MDKNRFYFLSWIVSSIIIAVTFVIAFIVSLTCKNIAIIFSLLITIWMPAVCIFLSKLSNDFIFGLGKEKMGKGKLIFLSTILFMAKYIVVILPLIIGLAINSASGTNYFEPISLVIGTLVYPLTTLVVQVYFVRIRDKDKKHD